MPAVPQYDDDGAAIIKAKGTAVLSKTSGASNPRIIALRTSMAAVARITPAECNVGKMAGGGAGSLGEFGDGHGAIDESAEKSGELDAALAVKLEQYVICEARAAISNTVIHAARLNQPPWIDAARR